MTLDPSPRRASQWPWWVIFAVAVVVVWAVWLIRASCDSAAAGECGYAPLVGYPLAILVTVACMLAGWYAARRLRRLDR